MASGFSTQQQVIAETVQLLQGLVIPASHGATVKGEHVHILVSSERDEASGTYSLILTFYPLARHILDWKQLPILLTPVEQQDLPAKVTRLGHRGQAIIRNLPEGTYRLSVSECWGISEGPVIIPASMTKRSAAESLAAADRLEKALWSELPPTFTSNDSRVTVTSEQAQPGMIALTFESSNVELDGAKVRFALVNPEDEAAVNAEVVLTQVEGRATYSGRWEGTVMTSEPCRLLFEVFPAE